MVPVLGHVLKHVPRHVFGRHVPEHMLEHMPGQMLKHVPERMLQHQFIGCWEYSSCSCTCSYYSVTFLPHPRVRFVCL